MAVGEDRRGQRVEKAMETRSERARRRGRDGVIIWGWCLPLGKRKNRVVQPGFM